MDASTATTLQDGDQHMRIQRSSDGTTPGEWSLPIAGKDAGDLDQHFAQTARDDSTGTFRPSTTSPLPLLEALSQEARLHSKLHRRLAEWAGRLTADPTLRDTHYRDVEDALNHACAVERAEAAATAFSVVAHHAEALSESLRLAQDYVATLYHDGTDRRPGRQNRSA